jgi:hypothetical protein
MLIWPWRSLVLAVTCAIILGAFLVPDPKSQDLSSLTTTELIRLLVSPREVIRQAASEQLIARAKTVVPELIRAAQNASGEQLREIVAILEELMLSSDQHVAELAELALESLGESPEPGTKDLALRTLHRNSTLRHSRALARIEELDGKVMIVMGNESSVNDELGDPAMMAAALTAGRPRPTTRVVVLDQNWQGGDAGLQCVSRLFPGESLTLHVTDDAPVTAARLQQLRAQRHHTFVRRPQHGCLGVSYREDSVEPVISSVTVNSPAERAGLRAGDVIVELGGKPIVRFGELHDWARGHRPSELIDLTVHRRGESVRVRFALGTDFGSRKPRDSPPWVSSSSRNQCGATTGSALISGTWAGSAFVAFAVALCVTGCQPVAGICTGDVVMVVEPAGAASCGPGDRVSVGPISTGGNMIASDGMLVIDMFAGIGCDVIMGAPAGMGLLPIITGAVGSGCGPIAIIAPGCPAIMGSPPNTRGGNAAER